MRAASAVCYHHVFCCGLFLCFALLCCEIRIQYRCIIVPSYFYIYLSTSPPAINLHPNCLFRFTLIFEKEVGACDEEKQRNFWVDKNINTQEHVHFLLE